MLNSLLRAEVPKLADFYGVRYFTAKGLKYIGRHQRGSNNAGS